MIEIDDAPIANQTRYAWLMGMFFIAIENNTRLSVIDKTANKT
nr:hypothetical protein [Colwellia maritima]